MLLFTPEQSKALNAERHSFNVNQDRIAVADAMVGNAATVPLRAWERIDSDAKQLQRDELVIFNSLAAANTQPISIADVVNYYAQHSNSGGAHISMEGRSRGNEDKAQVKYKGTSVPVIDDFVSYEWREMEVLKKGGDALDTTSIFNSGRTVAEGAENMVLNGASVSYTDAPIYGLRTLPERESVTHSLTALNGATGAQWLDVIKTTIQAQHTQKAYGRNTVYVNFSDWFYAQVTEFTAGYPKKIAAAILEIEQVARVIPSTRVPANEVIMVAGLESRQWGKILSAMPLSTTPLQRANIRDRYVFATMMAAAPQFRVDFDGNSQIAHMTKV